MIKFINEKEEIISFDKDYVEINEDVSPINEIINKKDISNFSLILGEDESNKISLNDVFHLQVNVKGVGQFHFLLNKDGFDKEHAIEQISTLKEMKIDDQKSAKEKVFNLFGIINQHNPLLLIYVEYKDAFLYSYDIDELLEMKYPCIAIPKINKVEKTQELAIGGEQNKDESNSNKTKKEIFKIKWKRFVNDLNKNKFHLLLVMVSTLLAEVSIPLAILNIYSSNLLYIFLFICSAIGIAMNVYSYLDYFRRKDLKNPVFYYSLISNAIGIGIGIGVFAIFYNISTQAEGTPGFGNLTLLGFLITFIICIATVLLVIFIPRKPKKVDDN